eukprot:scaffold6382_cov115-Skeletonema_dohrnii-CCMP3373.AAC.1
MKDSRFQHQVRDYVMWKKAPNLKFHAPIFDRYVILDEERSKYGLKLLLCNNIAPTYFGKESSKPYYS